MTRTQSLKKVWQIRVNLHRKGNQIQIVKSS